MHIVRFVLVAISAWLLTSVAVAHESSPPSGPGVDQLCMECGVVYEIRQLAGEREAARTFQEQAPPAGPFIDIPIGRGSHNSGAQIGVIGSKEQRESMEEITYEVVIRYDDGRFTLIVVSDIADLSVGTRVHVHQNRIEPADS